jgi:hypothetical protein
MVQETLRQLDNWYNEPGVGSQRPKLLSKLAMLELCGWIEGELDRVVISAVAVKLNDAPWVNEKVIGKTSGFHYGDHLRPMIARLVGETFARQIEIRMEQDYPGELDRLKELLTILWKRRCGFAHADVNTNIATQQAFDAPSYSLNQYRIVKKLVDHFELAVRAALAGI